MNKRLKILDIWVDAITKPEAIQRVADILKYGQRPHSILAANPEKNFSVPKDPELYEVFRQADILLPDGIGMVLAARILYGASLDRIPGAEFFEDICMLAVRGNYRVFFYGATEEVNRNATAILQERFPGLVIAGRANGYISPQDMPDLIKQINLSQAEILFIALGSPRQEKWFGSYKDSLRFVKVVQGIGGTLDTITGKVKRAPAIWRKAHTEWLYRLLREPKRMNRQKVLPLFLLNVLIKKLKSLL